MNVHVSQLAYYCAHCGHIEPENPEDDSFVFVHLGSCRATDNAIAHEMFNALANAMTHMKMNDILTERFIDHATKAMQPFASEFLNEHSYSFKWLKKDCSLATDSIN